MTQPQQRRRQQTGAFVGENSLHEFITYINGMRWYAQFFPKHKDISILVQSFSSDLTTILFFVQRRGTNKWLCSFDSFRSFVCPNKLLGHLYATQEGEIWYVNCTYKFKINQGVLVGQSPFLGITSFSTVQHTSLHTPLYVIFIFI